MTTRTVTATAAILAAEAKNVVSKVVEAAAAREAAIGAFTWERFVAIQVWLFVCFLVYVTVTELSALSGARFVELLLGRRHPVS